MDNGQSQENNNHDDYFKDHYFYEDENFPNFPDFGDLFRTKNEFSSRKQLTDWVIDVGKQNNMYFSIQSSRRGNGKGKGRVIIGCERGGRYRYNFRSISKIYKPRRNTKTRKTKCPFQLTGKEQSGGTWKLVVASKYSRHNHDLGVYHQWHSSVAKLTEKEVIMIENLRKANVKPKQMLKQLKIENPYNVSNKKHVDNALQKIKRKQMGLYTPIQYFFKSLNDKKYLEWHREDDNTKALGDVLFAHPSATNLLRLFPHVVLMDATYRTNRYDLPLLEIIGVSPTGQNFHVAFGFLKDETYESYLWAMEKVKILFGRDNSPGVIVTDREFALMKAAKHVFPSAAHLLCKRHIAKDVERYVTGLTRNKKIASAFSTRWGKIVNSVTENEYNKVYGEMKKAWKPRLKAVVKYVKKTWLKNFRTNFVSLWTKNILHFGARTTNRVESAHSQLKSWLGTATGAFHVILDKIDPLVVLQLEEIMGEMEKSRTSTPHITSYLLFSRLKFKVSHHAISLIENEYKYRFHKVGTNVEECGCEMRSSYGLPCAHELNELAAKKIPIDLSDIHEFWKTLDIEHRESRGQQSRRQTALQWFDELCNEVRNRSDAQINSYATGLYEMLYPECTNLEEPIQRSHKGRPKNKAPSSTKRDPSAWETSEKKASKGKSKGQWPKKRKHAESNLNQEAIPNKAKEQNNQQNVREESTHGAGERSTLEEVIHKVVPECIWQYIGKYENVGSDGNCGFRTIAKHIYKDESKWRVVRMDLTEELLGNEDLYKTRAALGISDFYDDSLFILDWQRSPAPSNNWFDASLLGPVVATRYQRIFAYWSENTCVTFLPLETRLIQEPSTEIMSMLRIYGCHFIPLYMASDTPLPHVVSLWESRCHEDVKHFKLDIKGQLDKFCDLIYPGGKETILYDVSP